MITPIIRTDVNVDGNQSTPEQMVKEERRREFARAKSDAMKEAGTTCCAEFRNGDHVVALIPTWCRGRKSYRKVAWTSFEERVGLGAMPNTYYSAAFGLPYIFAGARADLAIAKGAA